MGKPPLGIHPFTLDGVNLSRMTLTSSKKSIHRVPRFARCIVNDTECPSPSRDTRPCNVFELTISCVVPKWTRTFAKTLLKLWNVIPYLGDLLIPEKEHLHRQVGCRDVFSIRVEFFLFLFRFIVRLARCVYFSGEWRHYRQERIHAANKNKQCQGNGSRLQWDSRWTANRFVGNHYWQRVKFTWTNISSERMNIAS